MVTFGSIEKTPGGIGSIMTEDGFVCFEGYQEPVSKDYEVVINGKICPVYTARVSALPYPGWGKIYRDMKDTELASFINIESDEKLEFTVKCRKSFKEAAVRPLSQKIDTKVKDNIVCFNIKKCGQYVLELDDEHCCLTIFINDINKFEAKSTATYYFGAGIHFPGVINLKSGDSIYIDRGAVVYGSLFGKDLENINIFGYGILDDSYEYRLYPQLYSDSIKSCIKLYNCRNVNINGIICRNAAGFVVNLFECSDILIDNIKLIGQYRPNTDGIDIFNSQNILVKNSFARTFDDTICIKAIDDYSEFNNENITIDNCVLWNDWGRTCEIGMETACDHYSNIIFKNCDLIYNNYSCLDIQSGDYAEIRDIIFENMNIEYRHNSKPGKIFFKEGDIYDDGGDINHPILINISVESFRKMYMASTPDNYIMPHDRHGSVHNIIFRNINVYYDNRILSEKSKYYLSVNIKSHEKNVAIHDILIEKVFVNNEKIDKSDDLIFNIDNESAFNVQFK